MPRSQRSEELLAMLGDYMDRCDEANDLLEFADRARGRIEWDPAAGIPLRDALREAKRRNEGQ